MPSIDASTTVAVFRDTVSRLKDWRRVATRYDRLPTIFFSAVALAPTVIFRLGSTSPDPKARPPWWRR